MDYRHLFLRRERFFIAGSIEPAFLIVFYLSIECLSMSFAMIALFCYSLKHELKRFGKTDKKMPKVQALQRKNQCCFWRGRF